MVLYIAKRGRFDISSATHLQALKDIYGEDNVFMVDLIHGVPQEKNYVYYERSFSITERIIRCLQGNTSHINNKMINEICDLIAENNIDLIFSAESDLGNLMKKIKKLYPHVKIICFYRDISADLFRQRQKNMPGLKLYYKLIECNLTIRQEKISQRYVDENWVFNASDSERFQKYYGYSPTAIVPMASYEPQISEATKAACTNKADKKKMLFVCSKYYVNKQGFKWFYDNVLPNIKGDFVLNVVGMGTSTLLDFCKDKRVNLIGPVDDLSEYYLEADIVITPIFDGGGMKVKTMEAVSYAKNIVGTEESLHGFWERMPDNVRYTNVFQCNTAQEWQDALEALLNKDLKKFNEDVYDIFVSHFSYQALLASFKELLSR